ncbi:MAG TPA: hypothetical protein VNS58_18775 [Puia sp.]|nr:hypothetical protein [Puia sp.]
MNTIMGAAKPINQEINHYLDHLNAQQKKVVLSVVKTFAHEESDWWDGVEDAAKESIDKGLKDVEQGKLTPHNEVMKKYKKWLSK